MVKATVKFTPEHFEIINPQVKITLKQKLFFCIGIPVSFILIFLDFTSTGKIPWLFCAIAAVLCVCAALMQFLHNLTAPEKAYQRSIKEYPNMISTFIFDNNKIVSSLSADGYHGASEYEYKSVESVCKKDVFYVIKLKQNVMLVFREDEITDGSESELTEIFSRFHITVNYGNFK